MTGLGPVARASMPPLKLTVAPLASQDLPESITVDALLSGGFRVDRRKLEQLCDQIFGVDRDWQLHSDQLLVDWGRADAVAGRPAAGDPPDAPPSIAFSFACFRLLVSSSEDVRDVRTVITHLFVDHAWAMTFGRELFGLPALFGVFEGDRDTLVIGLDGLKPGDPKPVFTLSCSDGEGPARARSDSLGTTSSAAPDEGVLHEHEMPFVQSKQMRDGLQGMRACYQALVKGKIKIRSTGERWRPSSLTLTASDPDFAEAFGIEAPVHSADGYRTEKLKLSLQVQSPVQKPILRSGREGPSLRPRHGDPQAAPPYRFTDVDIVGFRLPVRQDLLQALCNRWLNEPFPDRSYHYEPANVDLVIECLHYPSMTAENPAFGADPKTATSQRELVFRILVGRVDEDGRSIRAPAVFCPFVFVDSIPSLISGREVIGYPKLLAKFEQFGLEGRPFDACRISAVTPTPTVRTKDNVPLLTLDCRFEREPRDVAELFEERPAHSGREAPGGTNISANFAWWNLGDLQSGGANANTFIQPWLSGQSYGYPGLQVKRFNDARSLRRECYHEIVDCEYTLLKAAVSLPLHDASLHFPEDDVYGIAAAFDFASVVPVPPGAWYRTKADFAFSVVDPLA